MSKFLVSPSAGEVRSTHSFPMDFSVAGHYIIDVPTVLQVKAQSKSVADLVAAKVAAFKGLHPSLPISFNDELITNPNVDTTKSTRYTVGPNKGTIILPGGGQVVTNLITIGSLVAKVFSHWYGFTLLTDPALSAGPGAPPPDRTLFNYDPVAVAFQEFIPTTFTVQIRNAANTMTFVTLGHDTEQPFMFGPGDIRLRFTNNDPDRPFHLSDWILLLG